MTRKLVPAPALLLALATSLVATSLFGARAAAQSRPRRELPLAQKLQHKRITVTWEDRELQGALKDLSIQIGTPFLLFPELRDRAEERVTLSVKRMRALNLLRILADLHDITFLRRGEVVFATTPENAVKRTAVLRIYDARSNLYRPTDFPGPELGLRRPGSDFEPRPRAITRDPMDPGELVDIIRNGIGSEEWDFEGVSIDATSHGQLIVRHTPRVQRKVARILLMLGSL